MATNNRSTLRAIASMATGNLDKADKNFREADERIPSTAGPSFSFDNYYWDFFGDQLKVSAQVDSPKITVLSNIIDETLQGSGSVTVNGTAMSTNLYYKKTSKKRRTEHLSDLSTLPRQNSAYRVSKQLENTLRTVCASLLSGMTIQEVAAAFFVTPGNPTSPRLHITRYNLVNVKIIKELLSTGDNFTTVARTICYNTSFLREDLDVNYVSNLTQRMYWRLVASKCPVIMRKLPRNFRNHNFTVTSEGVKDTITIPGSSNPVIYTQGD